jgi:ribosomal protein S5
VVVGNQDGLIGVGQHSGKNIQKVMLDAQLKAYQNLVAIPRYREHTVYHPIDITVRKVRAAAERRRYRGLNRYSRLTGYSCCWRKVQTVVGC